MLTKIYLCGIITLPKINGWILNMAKNLKRGLALLLAILTVCGSFGISVAAAETSAQTGSYSSTAIASAKELLGLLSYEEYVSKYSDETLYPKAESTVTINGTEYDESATDAEVTVETFDGTAALCTPELGTVSYKVNVPNAGKYAIKINYWPIETGTNSTNIVRILRLNNTIPFSEVYNISMTKVWQPLYDEADKYELDDGTVRLFFCDVDNNEMRATAVQTPEWCTYDVRDADGFYEDAFEFWFEAGENSISLEAVSEKIAIGSIELYPYSAPMSYEDYIAQYASKAKGTDKIKIEAEEPSALSTNTIYPVEDRSSAANSPCDASRTVLNTLGGEKWQVSGQWVEYTFTVNADGLYQIVPRFKQTINDGIYSSRELTIYSDETLKAGDEGYYNGCPFAEARELRFNYSTDWQVAPLQYAITGVDSKGKNTIEYQNCEFFFKAGVEYTIRFQVVLGSLGELVSDVSSSLEVINQAYLNILKLTGADPDESRDYYFASVMPETVIDIIVQAGKIQAISDLLLELCGTKSSNTSTLDNIARLLGDMGHDPEGEIAKGMSELKSYIGNLGTWLTNAKTQPLQVDYIMIQSADEKLPKASPNFFEAFWYEIKSFFQSFFRNYDRMGATAEDLDTKADAIDVWIATARDQAQVIRNLTNNNFTPNTGVTVNLKLIAGGTLLPSILAGQGPDVYLGIGDDTIINYAIRGAIHNIENYKGFTDMLYYKVDEKFNTVYDSNGNPVVNENHLFNDAAMMVLGIADNEDKMHYYGLPESQSFSMMFVRTDIMADLGITSLDTWDDILEAATVLSQNSMTIGLSTDYKIFLYQMGGTLFADNGMRINLDSNLALDSFETMCNMFTMYSFPYKYDFSNRFRTGEMPIGISGAVGTYNGLIVFATELRGRWQFVPVPGFKLENEDGTTYISNAAVSGVSAVVMINGCDQEEDSWEFMKWYVGKECQVSFANEMIAILGDSAKQPTANIEALQSMPWTEKERANLVAQFNNLASIPNYPGSYIIGRYTNFSFLGAYNNGLDPVAKLLSYISLINKEITRKRSEFGLETLQLGQTLASKRYYMIQYLLGNINENQLLGEKGMTSARNSEIKVLSDEDKYDVKILENLKSGVISADAKEKAKDELKAVEDAFNAIIAINESFKVYTEPELVDALRTAGTALYEKDKTTFATIYEYITVICDSLIEYNNSYPLEKQ